MAVVRTDLRNTRESARRLRFEPVSPLTATDVQKAIEQVVTTPQAVNPTSIAASPYAPLLTDSVLWVDTTAARTINLPTGASRAGRPLQIKDITGTANANNITLTPSGAETIDGLAPMLIDINYGGVTLYPKPAGGWATQP